MQRSVEAFIKDEKKEKWIENFARFGIVSKGVVYCLIGILTAMAAFGLQGKKAGKADAFNLIYEQPFGKILLIIVACGLLGYVTWRFFQAFGDIDHKGNDNKAKVVRAGYAISAFIYLGLAVYAGKLALMGPGGSDGNSQQFIVSKILSYSFGEWIIGITGAIIIGNAFRQIYKGASKKFMKNVQFLGANHSDAYEKAGILGYIARGVVLIIVGYFFVRGAIHSNSSEIADTKEAFGFIENTFGSLLMGIVAIGLVCYGIFMFVKARYQKIDLNF